MSEQPRDEKGRFAKKEKKADWFVPCVVASLVFIFLLALVWAGYHDGYNKGYHNGLEDNQPAIYAQGYIAGMKIADNQNELAKEWKPCFLYMNPPKFVCSIKDKNTIAEIDGEYRVIKTYQFPDDTESFFREWVKE